MPVCVCDARPVEDIVTGLSRIKWLFVIACNSSFAYKGRAIDVKQVGRELGALCLKRREFLGVLAGAAAWPRVARGQQRAIGTIILIGRDGSLLAVVAPQESDFDPSPIGFLPKHQRP